MEDILERARGLGRAMGGHPRFKAYLDASRRLQEDKAAAQALAAYNKAVATIAEKERRLRPVEVAEKQDLERLRQTVASNLLMKAFMKAQADWAELMRSVNDAIYNQLAPPESPPGAGPKAPGAPPPGAGPKAPGPPPPKAPGAGPKAPGAPPTPPGAPPKPPGGPTPPGSAHAGGGPKVQ